MEKIYLPGLNGIRAFAASSVILCHIFLRLKDCGLERSTLFNYFAIYGVTIFFTLSGFLITYLLLKEVDKYKTVNIQKFYMRRVLRIWPLYFLFILIVLVVMKFDVQSNIFYYLFIIPNVPFAVSSAGGGIAAITLLDHYWSLGVEEQFYAFWSWVIKYVKKLKFFFILFIIGFVALKFGLKLLHAPATIVSLVYYTRFSCLVIGALGAYYFHYHSKSLSFLNHKLIDLSSWIILFLLMTNVVPLYSIIANEIVSVLTLIIIFNQVNNTNPIVSLENKTLDYLGKISFGLYMYNPLIIYLYTFLFVQLDLNPGFLKIGTIIIVEFLTVIAVSHISYYYFEKPFLKIKHKFTTIESLASSPSN